MSRRDQDNTLSTPDNATYNERKNLPYPYTCGHNEQRSISQRHIDIFTGQSKPPPDHKRFQHRDSFNNLIQRYNHNSPSRLPTATRVLNIRHNQRSGTIHRIDQHSGRDRTIPYFRQDRLDIPPSIKVQFFIRHSVIIHDEQIRLFQ